MWLISIIQLIAAQWIFPWYQSLSSEQYNYKHCYSQFTVAYYSRNEFKVLPTSNEESLKGTQLVNDDKIKMCCKPILHIFIVTKVNNFLIL